MDEFSLIEKFFLKKTISRSDVLMGIGDDGALLQVPKEQLLVASIDTLIEGVHFLRETNPFDIGYKALTVNLSDLAAMGAEPAWATLALTVPRNDSSWFDEFTEGFFQIAHQFNVQLVGGDTTKGPLTITVQAHGFVPPGEALSRSGAKVGDKIYVSGTVGDAGFALQVAIGKYDLPLQEKEFFLHRLNRPVPQIKLGKLLRGLANSAIDISDGLFADLKHILKSSRVGATIVTDNIPLSDAIKKYLPFDQAKELALTAGDDYELCFTVSPEKEGQLLALLRQEKIACSCIGEIKEELECYFIDYNEKLSEEGFRHFK